MPFIGGKKNGQAGSVYDCAALFAYYKVVPDKPTLEEFEKMNEELFMPIMEKGHWVNLNNPFAMKAADFIYKTLSKKSKKHREDWPGNYTMETEKVHEGTKYYFRTCPIADMAKRLGYTHLMPAMCNPDYPMLKALRGGLIRTSTRACGDYCDFWVVGSDSSLLKAYSQTRKENGYIISEPKKDNKTDK